MNKCENVFPSIYSEKMWRIYHLKTKKITFFAFFLHFSPKSSTFAVALRTLQSVEWCDNPYYLCPGSTCMRKGMNIKCKKVRFFLCMSEFFCTFAVGFENSIENGYSEIWMVWYSRNGFLHLLCRLAVDGDFYNVFIFHIHYDFDI